MHVQCYGFYLTNQSDEMCKGKNSIREIVCTTESAQCLQMYWGFTGSIPCSFPFVTLDKSYLKLLQIVTVCKTHLYGISI